MRQDATFHSIQLLRAVAATLVVLFHTQQSFAHGLSAPLFDQETYLFAFGAVGVHIFFVISGFIMVLTGRPPGKPYNAPQFLKRRLLRIYPIYWLCALAYVATHAAIGRPYDVSPGDFVGALLLWPGDAARLIGPAWTLSFEMYFYICFGLAMMLSLTRGLIVLGAAFMGAIALGQLLPDKGSAMWLVTNPLLLEFLAGAAIGWLAHAGRLPLRWGPALTGLGVALFGAGIVIGFDRLPSAVSWGVPSAVLVLGLVSWELRSGAAPAVRRLGKLGDSSYVLYLIHVLMITLALALCQTLGLAPAPPLAAGILALLAIPVAEVIHRKVELPMLALLRRNRGRAAPAGETVPGTRKSPDRALPPARAASTPAAEPPVVVSITTIPSRIAHIRPTLESLLQGELVPSRILLVHPEYSAREQVKYEIPAFLTDPSFGQGIVEPALVSTDWGPGTKYLGALEHIHEDCYLVIADDDVCYRPQFLRQLVEAQKSDHDASFSFYTYREGGVTIGQGCDGMSFWSPNLAGLRAFAERHVGQTSLRFHDDLWVSYFLALRGIPIRDLRPLLDGGLVYEQQLADGGLAAQSGALAREEITRVHLARLHREAGMPLRRKAWFGAMAAGDAGIGRVRRTYRRACRIAGMGGE
ncbi:MAG: acyltransferase [Novosphingobium sp.]